MMKKKKLQIDVCSCPINPIWELFKAWVSTHIAHRWNEKRERDEENLRDIKITMDNG